jgi:pimeloyl-ACP methyl ester carboxylesterase
MTTDPTTPLHLVAVHGNGGGASRFASFMDTVGDRAHVHAVTLPGFSTSPRDPALVTVSDYADHLATLVQTSPVPPVLLGHGIGGSFALDLAARRPELLSGLILHAPVGANLDTRLFPRIMSTRPVRAAAKRLIAARAPRPLWRRLFFPHGAPRPVLDTFFDEYRTCEAFGQMFEIITPAWFTQLPVVRNVPSVVLWGEHDRVLRSGQADVILNKVPEAEVIVQPGWDHFPMIEQPADYAEVILDIARGLVARGPAA